MNELIWFIIIVVLALAALIARILYQQRSKTKGKDIGMAFLKDLEAVIDNANIGDRDSNHARLKGVYKARCVECDYSGAFYGQGSFYPQQIIIRLRPSKVPKQGLLKSFFLAKTKIKENVFLTGQVLIYKDILIKQLVKKPLSKDDIINILEELTSAAEVVESRSSAI